MQILPLDNRPNQKFKTTLSIDGVNKTISFNLKYNEIAKYWVMTISDPIENKILIDSHPILTGEFPAGNILEQFSYLGIGSAFIINTSNASLDSPDNKSLGNDFKMVWSDTI